MRSAPIGLPVPDLVAKGGRPCLLSKGVLAEGHFYGVALEDR